MEDLEDAVCIDDPSITIKMSVHEFIRNFEADKEEEEFYERSSRNIACMWIERLVDPLKT